MRIVVAYAGDPFAEDTETLARAATDALIATGVTADSVNLPVSSNWDQVPSSSLAMRLFELAPWADRLVTIGTPAHLLRHPNKIAWLIADPRSAEGEGLAVDPLVPDAPADQETLTMIRRAGRTGLCEARRVFADSPATSRGLSDLYGVDSEVLIPPSARSGSEISRPTGSEWEHIVEALTA